MDQGLRRKWLDSSRQNYVVACCDLHRRHWCVFARGS